MKISNMEERNLAFSNSMENLNLFWNKITFNYSWHKHPTKSLTGTFDQVDMKWFEDGQLNITENALDRHLSSRSDKIALIFEPNDPDSPQLKITYKELHTKVCQTADLLSRKGIRKGDVVCLYMSMIPELLISVLACARIGAIHSVVFGGFSAKSLSERIDDCRAKLIITNDSGHRGDKDLAIKQTVDEALDILSLNKLKVSNLNIKVMVWKHSNKNISMLQNRDFYAHDEIDKKITEFKAITMNAEDPLFILYTSGSTGKPKGLLHTTAGYMIWASETYKNVFQLSDPKDIYWCTADIGWITGHSYICYGPTLNGVTQVMFEGIPTWPTPARFWQIIEKHKVTHFYTAPTAIRALQAFDLSYVKSVSLKSLKVLGTVGEPINEEAWHWYKNEIGNNQCPIVDTWWQTETGGIMISNLAGVTPEKPSMATLPLPGVDAVIVNEKSEIQDGESEGHLCIRKPWPGIARTIFGDHDRFIKTYFSTHKGLYFTGDGAKRNILGEYRIIGRVDDVVNVSGHRIGTAEVEDVIDENENIVEAAVVGAHHDIKGQCLVAFVICKKQIMTSELIKQVNQSLTTEMGSIYKIDRLYQIPNLPKTRSGKIMRRLLRKIADGESDFGDISTLLNPEIVKEIVLTVQKNTF